MADDQQTGNEDLPWDAQTDQYIIALDPIISDQYGMTLTDLLMNPSNFSGTTDIANKVEGIRTTVNKFFGDAMSGMDDERTRLIHEMENVNMEYMKINDSITSKTLAARVPYVKPFFIDTNADLEEEVIIDQYNNSIDSLITKFIGISNYVADISGKYKSYTIGSWVFSGTRTYMISINRPTSPLISMENSNEYIVEMLDSIANSLKGTTTTTTSTANTTTDNMSK